MGGDGIGEERMTTKGSQSATNGSFLPDTISAEVEELRATLGVQSKLLIIATEHDARISTKLAQIRAILAGVLIAAGIETTDDVVRLAQQVRALVRALEAAEAEAAELRERLDAEKDEQWPGRYP